MARKQNGPQYRVTRLRLPLEQVQKRIQERITLGEDLLSRKIGTQEQLSDFKRESERWSSYNQELLRKLFDTDQYLSEYTESKGAWVNFNPALSEEIEYEQENIKASLNKLQSVLEISEILEGPVSQEMVRLSETNADPAEGIVFIVHGHDEAAKLAVARFVSELELKPVILHEMPNKGRTVIEKFEDYAKQVMYAIILLTPDDRGYALNEKQKVEKLRARQNVIFELGFFVSKLGRSKICALCKGDIEIPTDYGVLYTPMDDHDGWKIKLAKEMKAAGLPIDMNKMN